MGNKGVLVLMDKVLKQITKIISDIHDRQSVHSTDILRSRYEKLELLKVLQELGVIETKHIERIYKKGEEYEQSSNESRGSTGDIHQSLSES
jgi:hypothetical protein